MTTNLEAAIVWAEESLTIPNVENSLLPHLRILVEVAKVVLAERIRTKGKSTLYDFIAGFEAGAKTERAEIIAWLEADAEATRAFLRDRTLPKPVGT